MISLSHHASIPPDSGLFRTPATLSSSILSAIPGDGGRLVIRWGVLCMYLVRRLLRVVQGACDAPLLLTGLRAGTLREQWGE